MENRNEMCTENAETSRDETPVNGEIRERRADTIQVPEAELRQMQIKSRIYDLMAQKQQIDQAVAQLNQNLAELLGPPRQ